MLRKGEKTQKSQEAITLIALVITIIVLLILAGVTIATLTGQNGILTNSAKSKNDTELANAKEQVELALQAIRTDNLGDITNVLPEDIIHELQQGGINGAETSTNTFPTKITMPGGIEVTVDENLTITDVNKGTTEGGNPEPPKLAYPDESQWAPASEFRFDPETGTVEKYLGTSNTVIIPEKIDGVTVKSLSWDSLKTGDTSSGPRNITIPATVTQTENSAFMEYKNVDITCYAKAETVNYYFIPDPNGPSAFYNGVMRFVNDDILVASNGYVEGETQYDWQKIVYRLNKNDKTAEVIGTGDRHGSSNFEIGEKIEEYKITKIKTNAITFLYNQTGDFENVVVSPTVEIESGAIDAKLLRYFMIEGETLADVQKIKIAPDFIFNVDSEDEFDIIYYENGEKVYKSYATLEEFLNALKP